MEEKTKKKNIWVNYLLILLLIVLIIIIILAMMGPYIGNVFSNITTDCNPMWRFLIGTFIDTNSDGIWNVNEKPLEGVEISVDAKNSYGKKTIFTNENGEYWVNSFEPCNQQKTSVKVIVNAYPKSGFTLTSDGTVSLKIDYFYFGGWPDEYPRIDFGFLEE